MNLVRPGGRRERDPFLPPPSNTLIPNTINGRKNMAKVFVLPYPEEGSNIPDPRSGHRIFSDSNYLYVIGGFSNSGHDHIFHEMWRMNLLSYEWTKLFIPEDFPIGLASFACCPLREPSNQFMIFGGTPIPFGNELNNDIFLCFIDDDSVKVKEVSPGGDTRGGCYGHAMARDEETNKFYIIGGTSGRIFSLDVWAVSEKEPEKWEWECEKVDDEGFYRLEVTLDGNKIYLFGGGTPDVVKDFDELTVYDTKRREYEYIRTKRDPIHGYPLPRRCHGLSRFGRCVFMTGGCSEDYHNLVDEERRAEVYGDVWMFNLDSLSWTRLADLVTPVCFHDSTITDEGLLLVFGGVIDQCSQVRTNRTQAMWLTSPPLYYSALQHFQHTLKENVSGPMETKEEIFHHVYRMAVPPA